MIETAENAPPQNPDAENHVLGAIMLSPRALDASRDLNPTDWYRESNARIHRAALDLDDRGEPVSPVTLCAELERTGQLEDAGGRARIHEIAHIVPAAANAAHYVKLIQRAARLRHIRRAALDIAQDAQQDPDRAEQKLHQLVEEIAGREERQSLWTGTAIAERYRQLLENPLTEDDGVPTPFKRLRPMQPGRLYVLGGYQGDGKTVLAVQFLRAAAEAGRKVGFVSIEMSAEDLAARIVGTFGVPYHQAQTGAIDPIWRPRVERALEFLQLPQVNVLDDPAANPAGIGRYQRQGRYDLLIVDHLHMMEAPERDDLRVATSRHVTALTRIARQLEVPILLLAQLHRGHTDQFPRPTMKSLKESSTIEQLASSVWLVYRKRDQEDLVMDEAELIVAKGRYSAVGKVPLLFNGANVRFEEAA